MRASGTITRAAAPHLKTKKFCRCFTGGEQIRGYHAPHIDFFLSLATSLVFARQAAIESSIRQDEVCSGFWWCYFRCRKGYYRKQYRAAAENCWFVRLEHQD